MSSIDVVPVILEGRTVRLEPLRFNHASGLARNVDPAMFRYFAGACPKECTEEACLEYIRKRMTAPAVSFAIVCKELEVAVGHTSYMEVRAEDRAPEIGSTWLGKTHQGTKVNPECKLLLLQHAFEDLRCNRVQLKTDERNLQSRAAIEKLGAKFEGILRKHSVMNDGFVRNTAMYSIIDDEWPNVKKSLIERLGE